MAAMSRRVASGHGRDRRGRTSCGPSRAQSRRQGVVVSTARAAIDAGMWTSRKASTASRVRWCSRRSRLNWYSVVHQAAEPPGRRPGIAFGGNQACKQQDRQHAQTPQTPPWCTSHPPLQSRRCRPHPDSAAVSAAHQVRGMPATARLRGRTALSRPMTSKRSGAQASDAAGASTCYRAWRTPPRLAVGCTYAPLRGMYVSAERRQSET